MNHDGSEIVCGGGTKKDKKTCDTFLETPPSLPTREEVVNAEMSAKESKEPKAD